MARKAPVGPPSLRQVWVYTLHLDPPYPSPACANGHQVGHYTGIAPGALPHRMTVQAEGGPHAARLLQVQKAAGGTFHLVSIERGTQDRETALKYRGATRRCAMCKAGPASAAGSGWVVLLHLDRAISRQTAAGEDPAPSAHWAGYLPDIKALYAATEKGGRAVTSLLQVPEVPGGTWRLVSAERTEHDWSGWVTARRAAYACPQCTADRAQARAAEVLAAIEFGEVADRYHPVKGWTARWYIHDGQPVVCDGPGGELGRNVTATANALLRRGLARRPAWTPAWGGPLADCPYLLTRAGWDALQTLRTGRPPGPRWRLPGVPAAVALPAAGPRADGLPVTRDGRLWVSKLADEQRARAGAMTRSQAKEHDKLVQLVLESSRPVERSWGKQPPDIWTVPASPPEPAKAPPAPVRSRPGRSLADLTWPSGVLGGLEAAPGPGPRRAPASRRAALRVSRGAGR